MKRYFDRDKNRLVYVGEEPKPGMWDERWEKVDLEKLYFPRSYSMEDKVVIDVTKKYLMEGARILEGGCGLGDKVYFLKQSGYNVTGVDNASKTVEKVHEFMPELDIRYGDLRQLDYPDNFFDGYWSFGVIEHFYDGYDHIVREMLRILKPGGYLFLTVPAMSAIRRMKAVAGFFPKFKEEQIDISSFYQFTFTPEEIQRSIGKFGFQFVERQGWAVYAGVRSEIPGTHILMSFLCRYFEKPTWRLLIGYCNHMDLFVFRK